VKYVVLVGDGMADRPIDKLKGKTPLQAAFTPNMDKLAREGLPGIARTLPDGFPTGSDVANLNILGYDPRQFYTGRAPFEAASMGIKLREGDVAFRCNLVTLRFNMDRTKAWMEDHSGGQISSAEGRELIEAVAGELSSPGKISFYPGVSYRNIMLWRGGEDEIECTPPHDILGKEITDYLPCGKGEVFIRELMRASVGILERHPTNKKRLEQGNRPANSIWLWGQGRKPALRPFRELYGVSGAMISGVDLPKGIALSAGLKVINVPGATGYLDTNYTGKAEYALKALEDVDLVYIHVEAPDEAGHEGNLEDKIKAIENFDALVVGTVLRGIREFGGFRVLLITDHATPIAVRTHTQEPIPFVVYDNAEGGGKKKKTPPQSGIGYSELLTGLDGILRFEEAHKIMGAFIRGDFF
jgi:2,3-bisphosphoglycerate-independent phosphoglycerate mutase